MTRNRIFSGIQPTGNLHLGNYLGAIANWVRLQDHYECMFSVVDLHAITVDYDPVALDASVLEVSATLLAAGLDPERVILFRQSANPHHSELAWILSCTARTGWLNRMTQFKEKAGRDRERASVGLYTYPVLMASDILAYRATHVPVGEDQKQHLELCREIARKFNLDLACDLFPLIEPLIMPTGARIMSLRDGTRKMSKSDPVAANRIDLSDSPDEIRHKIRRARTDTAPLPASTAGLAGRSEAANLVGMLAALEGLGDQQLLDEVAGWPFSRLKDRLADALVDHLSPIAEERRRWLADRPALLAVLERGAARAIEQSTPVLTRVRALAGLAAVGGAGRG